MLDACGNSGEWLKLQDTLPITDQESLSVDASEFDPWLNDVVEIGFLLSERGRLEVGIRNSSRNTNPIRTIPAVASGGELEAVWWDGRKTDGSIHVGPFWVYFGVPQGVPANSILVRNPFEIPSVVCNAHLIVPSYNQGSEIRFTVSSNANVSLSLMDPNGNHFRTLLSDEPVGPGGQSVFWDGRNDGGMLGSLEGEYTVMITAVDLATQSATTRYAVVLSYR